MNRYVSLPQAAREAADRGDLLGAIKATQETSGISLHDAQRAVHAYVRADQRDETVGGRQVIAGSPAAGLPAPAVAALTAGNLIEAIRHTRNSKGLSLKEAKDAVEGYLRSNPHAKQQFDASLRVNSSKLTPLLGALVLVAALGLAAYFVFTATR